VHILADCLLCIPAQDVSPPAALLKGSAWHAARADFCGRAAPGTTRDVSEQQVQRAPIAQEQVGTESHPGQLLPRIAAVCSQPGSLRQRSGKKPERYTGLLLPGAPVRINCRRMARRRSSGGTPTCGCPMASPLTVCGYLLEYLRPTTGARFPRNMRAPMERRVAESALCLSDKSVPSPLVRVRDVKKRQSGRQEVRAPLWSGCVTRPTGTAKEQIAYVVYHANIVPHDDASRQITLPARDACHTSRPVFPCSCAGRMEEFASIGSMRHSRVRKTSLLQRKKCCPPCEREGNSNI